MMFINFIQFLTVCVCAHILARPTWQWDGYLMLIDNTDVHCKADAHLNSDFVAIALALNLVLYRFFS